MNPAVRDDPERRQCYRARISTSAMLRCRARQATCVRQLDDLSLGGAHLVGKPPMGVGASVTTTIKLGARGRITPRARIVRLTDDGDGFAIVFTELSPRAAELIHGCMVRSLEADEVSAVLLIEPTRRAREELEHLLTQAGYRVIAVATPVEAIDRLNAHADCIQAALVSQRLTQTSGVEFVGFLKDAFPDIRRVLTSGEEAEPAKRILRARGLVHGALSAPWLRTDLTRAIGARRSERAS